jgi:hypothetical protein
MTDIIPQAALPTGSRNKREPRKKPKKNAQEAWESLSQTNDSVVQSDTGSTCSSHISIIRVEMKNEICLQESFQSQGDALSDILKELVNVERRGINILNSREDLMDTFSLSNDIVSPPPELLLMASSGIWCDADV